jgi:hypothetical protein
MKPRSFLLRGQGVTESWYDQGTGTVPQWSEPTALGSPMPDRWFPLVLCPIFLTRNSPNRKPNRLHAKAMKPVFHSSFDVGRSF